MSPHATAARAATPDTPSPIPCADCLHCKVFKQTDPSSGRYILRVRCDRKHWVRGRRDRVEATYHLHTLLARRVPSCPDYESLSEDDDERQAYLNQLAEDLPCERYQYEPDGSFVGLDEEE